MTPQEKANELLIKFHEVPFKKWTTTDLQHAKQCALIAVDEIQNIYIGYVRDGRIEPVSNPTIFEYCEQVRQEIELLKE